MPADEPINKQHLLNALKMRLRDIEEAIQCSSGHQSTRWNGRKQECTDIIAMIEAWEPDNG